MKRLLLFCLNLVFSYSVFAQIEITGKVNDMEGEPLPGVSIIIKGTSSGTITNTNGEYSIKVPDREATLMFSFLGFNPEEIQVGDQTTINISLVPSIEALSEIVVVGYGTMKKENLTGSVSSVNTEELQNIPASDVASLIQGRLSGVTISNTNTQPGIEDATQIRIRGIGTLNSGKDPLIIVDGVQSSFSQIPVSDIESISVLKDAASASIYGVRAANGVILVTTKNGVAGKPTINFNANYGFQKNLVPLDLVDSWDYATIKNLQAAADGTAEEDYPYSAEDIQAMRDGSDPDHFANTDWAEETFRTAPMQTYYLSVSGGNESVRYLLSGEIFDQEGIMKGTSTKRYSLRSKIDADLSDKFSAGMFLSGYKKRYDQPIYDVSGNEDEGLNYSIRRFTIPTVPAYYSNGEYGWVDGNYDENAYIARNLLWFTSVGENYNDLYRLEGKAYVKYKILEGLTYSGSLAGHYKSNFNSKFEPTWEKHTFEGDVIDNNTVNNLENSETKNYMYVVENLLNYTKVLEKHRIHLLAGHSAQYWKDQYFKAYSEDFPNNSIHVLDAGVSNQSVEGWAQELTLQSFFGRVNYSFNDKYLLEANVRIDGTSRFPKESRWGAFPSVSAGWVLSNESFMEDLGPLSFLKLRVSWGQLGNQDIRDDDEYNYYPYKQTYSTGEDYIIGGDKVAGVAATDLANTEITWEKTSVTDIGFDVNFFNNKLQIVGDWFNKVSSDVLMQLSGRYIMGYDNWPYRNVGEIKNTGWELDVKYQDALGDLNYFAGFNVSHVKNEVLDLYDREEILGSYSILRVGEAINSYYGYVADGYWQSEAEINDETIPRPSWAGELAPGDIKYKDVSGADGVPDGEITEDDRIILGNPFPKLSYAFSLGCSYKGFDLNMFFQGVTGINRWQWYNNESVGNYTASLLDYWREDNTDAKFPRIGNYSNNSAWSSFWLKDASYLRLKNLELGYTLPKSLTERFTIDKLRVYFSGYNLLTFTKMIDYDPERLEDDRRSRSYPQAKVYSLGINLTF